jgi:hypothetical protein
MPENISVPPLNIFIPPLGIINVLSLTSHEDINRKKCSTFNLIHDQFFEITACAIAPCND